MKTKKVGGYLFNLTRPITKKAAKNAYSYIFSKKQTEKINKLKNNNYILITINLKCF